MSSFKSWIHAARLRTLPLALSSVLMGATLAYADGHVDGTALILAVITTLVLQILSNFANDYGDFSSGVDIEGRIGPERAMQGGHISPVQMKRAIAITSLIALISGIGLLLVADIPIKGLLILLGTGVLAIVAAITYTVGKRPYGYVGLGDLSVFLFFGLVGVLGSHYVIHGEFFARNILLASTLGMFSVGVLNLNNIRDLAADKLHRKNTIPVTLGPQKARIYHLVLLSSGWILAIIYILINNQHWTQWLIFLSFPLFVTNLVSLWNREERQIDPLLKQLAIATLLFVILNGLGWWLG